MRRTSVFLWYLDMRALQDLPNVRPLLLQLVIELVDLTSCNFDEDSLIPQLILQRIYTIAVSFHLFLMLDTIPFTLLLVVRLLFPQTLDLEIHSFYHL